MKSVVLLKYQGQLYIKPIEMPFTQLKYKTVIWYEKLSDVLVSGTMYILIFTYYF